MRRFIAGAAIAMAFSGAAVAQSGPGYNWTGYYLGVNGGFGWGLDEEVTLNYDPPCVAPGDCPDVVPITTEGFLAGGHAGANWHQNFWVYGIEGDIDWSDISGDGSATSGLTTATASTDLNWLATFRGRLGVAADRAFVYATGGLAIGDVENSATLDSTSAEPGLAGAWSVSDSDVEMGWTAGAGFEFAVTQHITIGAEALYVDLGERSVDLSQTPAVTPPDISADFENDFVIARGRVTFKW